MRDRLNIKSATIPHLFQYYGLHTLAQRRELFEHFQRKLAEKYDLAVFSLTEEEGRNYDYAGWRRNKRLTYYLQPDKFENMKGRCSPDVRNKINKAIKGDITIVKATDYPYNIYLTTFERRGKRPPVTRDELIAWVKELTDQGLAETHLAFIEGQPAAFRTQLIWHDAAYDWLAGADPAYSGTGVNQFLMLHIGASHADEGITHWDLLGGDLPGIGRFKRSFGSRPVHHLQIEKNFSGKGGIYRGLMKLRSKIDGRN
jgi:hypothetical protein